MGLERVCFLIVTAIASFGAIIHWIAPFLGVDWYRFLTSPQWVVNSARNGTWQAPVGAVVVGALMQTCGMFALSATGIVQRLPFLRTATCFIAILCTLRGALIFPLLWMVPKRLTAFDITASFVWLCAGICMGLGTYLRWAELREAP
ncbi:MAG: hypothetical protein E6Q34_05850 [Burkholderiaceae bacterium]|nr:MAG: hypothetical protein E6Q34_05850 [Burkholderiaceae bacterium]